MHNEGKAPNYLVRRLVGWQAGRIVDPVERLKFLRRTVGNRQADAAVVGSGATRWRRRVLGLMAGAAALLAPSAYVADRGTIIRPVPSSPGVAQAGSFTTNVWLVDQNQEFETYSNGLRIERRFETANEPRHYVWFVRGEEDSRPAVAGTQPSGIVYHTTESQLAPFAQDTTPRLKYLGESLLHYVREQKAYHFVVDRFGRVWRIVRESDAAWHAGASVWSDGERTWVSLNHSFLGVSLEAGTEGNVSGRAPATPAQIHALRVLTEMLRAKYHIAAINCITHAQVSVNPSNMQVGYHTDWAAQFPYGALGLPDNYAQPMPGLYLFGFKYDPSLITATGERYWKGLLLGEEQLRQDATAHGLTAGEWRRRLNARYRTVQSEIKERSAEAKEKQG